MPGVARKSGTDTVDSPDGGPIGCSGPSTQTTDVGSNDVIVNGIGVVRESDPMIPHADPAQSCLPHAPVLTTFSGTVFANGKHLGREGDAYGGSHIISSSSLNVFAGG